MAKKFFLLLALLLATLVNTWADDVNYIYYTVNEDGKTITKHEDGSQSNPTVLTSSLLKNSNEDNLNTGWYVLNTSFEYGERIVISGDVKLILKDGCTLTANQGIRINTDATLTIYAQSETVGTMGKLVAIETHHDKAAIGGNKNWEAGRLFIHGGEIEAKCNDGSKYAAGIGGGYGDGSGMKEITIYGGKVTAQGAKSGAGIGGGKNNNNPGTINIYGGDITANAGKDGAGIGGGHKRGNWPVNIYGGIVNAKGDGSGYGAFWDGGGAGIGGGAMGSQTAPINIYGGTVTAEGFMSAGIGGGGYEGKGGTIYIYGGEVTAKGTDGAGIGGGYGGKGGKVYIKGGTVTAQGGFQSAGIGGGAHRAGDEIYISGGTVTATSGWGGAAIGGGYANSGGTIEITGGHVTTKTSKDYGKRTAACDIGCGGDGSGYSIKFDYRMCVETENGLVAASKRFDACTNQKTTSSSELCTIEIYKCEHSDLYYTIEDEKKHVFDCMYCNNRWRENHKTNEFGQCSLCGYGSDFVICENTFYETSTAAYSDATKTLKAVKDKTIVLPSCSNVPDGMTFAGWLMANTDVVSGIEAADQEPLHPAGEVFTVTGNESFFARYRYDFTPTWEWNENLTSASLTIQAAGGEPITVTPVTVGTPTTVLPTMTSEGSITNTANATYRSGDDYHGYTTYEFSTQHTTPKYWDYSLMEDDNTSMLSTFNGLTGNVRLPYRTFYMDGNWNTLCLPFNVDDINSTPFRGATMKEMTDASFDNTTGTLTLTFANATSIRAGQAYLIKWPDTGDSHFNLTDVLFNSVTLTNYLCDDEISTDDTGSATVTFLGTYKKLTFDADDRTVLFLGADNTLYYPLSGTSIGAQRAYFKLSGLTAGDLSSGINAFTLNFGDEESVTGIVSIDHSSSTTDHSSGAWHSIDGRRLSGKPTQRGIYIYNGRKVVIK